MTTLPPGSMFGQQSTVLGKPWNVRAVAHTRVHAVVQPAARLRAMLAGNPHVQRLLLGFAKSKL